MQDFLEHMDIKNLLQQLLLTEMRINFELFCNNQMKQILQNEKLSDVMELHSEINEEVTKICKTVL